LQTGESVFWEELPLARELHQPTGKMGKRGAEHSVTKCKSSVAEDTRGVPEQSRSLVAAPCRRAVRQLAAQHADAAGSV